EREPLQQVVDGYRLRLLDLALEADLPGPRGEGARVGGGVPLVRAELVVVVVVRDVGVRRLPLVRGERALLPVPKEGQFGVRLRERGARNGQGRRPHRGTRAEGKEGPAAEVEGRRGDLRPVFGTETARHALLHNKARPFEGGTDETPR